MISGQVERDKILYAAKSRLVKRASRQDVGVCLPKAVANDSQTNRRETFEQREDGLMVCIFNAFANLADVLLGFQAGW